jgi:plastocyanin
MRPWRSLTEMGIHMKPNLRPVQLAALVAFGAVGPMASLCACEGEPPVAYPENSPGAGSGAIPAPEAASTADATFPVVEVPGQPPTAPCAPCAARTTEAPASASAAPAASSSGAPEAAPSPPSAEPAVHEGNVVGDITTKPAALAAYGAVYLEDGPKEGAPEHAASVTILNRQMAFAPFVTVVPAGQKVVFANADPFPHNVFSPDNEKFNMGNIPQNTGHARVFPNPGAYSLLCNLHPGMLGYLLVTPSGWFARTDAKGKFALNHVPPGAYKLTAWAPRQTPVTQIVTVTNGDATLKFDLHR